MTINDERACCQACGYPLVGLSSEGGECPECGSAYDASRLGFEDWPTRRNRVLASIARLFRMVSLVHIVLLVAIDTSAADYQMPVVFGPACATAVLLTGQLAYGGVVLIALGIPIQLIAYYHSIKWFFRYERTWLHLIWIAATILLLHILSYFIVRMCL